MHAGRHRIKDKKRQDQPRNRRDDHQTWESDTAAGPTGEPIEAQQPQAAGGPDLAATRSGEKSAAAEPEPTQAVRAGSAQMPVDASGLPGAPPPAGQASVQRVRPRRPERARAATRADHSTRVTLGIVAVIASLLLGYWVAVRYLVPPTPVQTPAQSTLASSSSELGADATLDSASGSVPGLAGGSSPSPAAGPTGELGRGNSLSGGAAGTGGGDTAGAFLPPLKGTGAQPQVSLPTIGQSAPVTSTNSKLADATPPGTGAGAGTAKGSGSPLPQSTAAVPAAPAASPSAAGTTHRPVRSTASRPPSGAASTSASPQPSGAALHRVVVGVVGSSDEAKELLARVKEAGFADAFVQANPWRVQVGAFRERRRADQLVSQLHEQGFPQAQIFERNSAP